MPSTARSPSCWCARRSSARACASFCRPREPDRLPLVAAVHRPSAVQTQAVTYIVQRCESLMATCMLLCLYALGRAAGSQESSGRWRGLAVIAALLGIECKEPGAVVLALAPLYLWIFFLDSAAELRRRFLPAFAAMAALMAAALAADLHQHQSSESFNEHLYPGWPIRWWQYLATEAQVLPQYARVLLLLAHQCFDYFWPYATALRDGIAPGLAVVAVLAAVGVGVARRSPWSFPAAAVFMVLAPTSSVVPIPDAAVEHRLYLPVLGIAVLLVSGILGLDRDAAPRRRLAVAALTGLILVLASLSWSRNQVYRTSEALWTDVLTTRPGNLRAAIYQGRFGDPQREMARFRAVLAEFPAMTDARLALAVDLLQVGRPLEAEAELTRAAAGDAGDAQVRAYLGQVRI